MDLEGATKSLESFIRWVMRGVSYHKPYPATVQSQDENGLVDVYPDSEDIRGNGLSKVPIWLGVPGSVKVPSGARCILRFENGDPTKPYVSGFGGADLTELKLGSGAQFVALANLVNTRCDAIESKLNAHITAYNTHVHPVPGVTTGGGATTSAVTPATVTNLGAGPDVSADKTKAE